MAGNEEIRAATAFDRKLGQRVRARRLEIGMSQERLAELLGITFQQVQKYEKGINRVAAGRLQDIATALDMPVARFFEQSSGRAAAAESSSQADAVLATAEGRDLIALFASINSVKVRRKVVELARALAEKS